MMKSYILFTLLFISTACISDKLDSEKYVTTDLIDNEIPPIMEFEKETYHFDTVALGSEVQYAFRFENTGDSYLLIHQLKQHVDVPF